MDFPSQLLRSYKHFSRPTSKVLNIGKVFAKYNTSFLTFHNHLRKVGCTISRTSTLRATSNLLLKASTASQFGNISYENRRNRRCRSVSCHLVPGGGPSSGGALNTHSNVSINPTIEERLHLRECRHFVNLTNGIEALPMLHELQLPYSFVRIQSTACEQQNLEALISELDANLLISLALGHCCLVYDCGSRGRNGTPRALWYGLEFVRYTLCKLWLRQPCPALLRGKNVARHFEEQIRAFKQSTTRRIKYYAKYLPLDSTGVEGLEGDDGCGSAGLQRLRLHGVFRPTDHDDDVSHFVRLLYQYQSPQASFASGGQRRGTYQLERRQGQSALSPLPVLKHRQQQQQQDQQHAGQSSVESQSRQLWDLGLRVADLEFRSRTASESNSTLPYETRAGGDSAVELQPLRSCRNDAATATAATAAMASSSTIDVGSSYPTYVYGSDEGAASDTEMWRGVAKSGNPPEDADAGCDSGLMVRIAETGGRSNSGGTTVVDQCKSVDEAVQRVAFHDTSVDVEDGEAVLARYGFRLFWRGLSPAEWAAKGAAAMH